MGAGYYDKLVSYLKDYGCYFVRQGKGSHEIWFSPISKRNFPVAYTIKDRGTANGICKQAGLKKNF